MHADRSLNGARGKHSSQQSLDKLEAVKDTMTVSRAFGESYQARTNRWEP
jgi:hypothetical protein